MKFGKNIDAKNVKNGVFEYFIYSGIGVDEKTGSGLSGQGFANDIDFVNNFMSDDVKQINVRINSAGGTILDGLSIMAAIKRSQIPVDTYVDGVAASIAGVIAMSGRKRYMNDFARIMVHDPKFETEQLSDQEKNAIQNFKDMLITIFKNNSNHSTEEIDAIMTAETWFNADEALKSGLIDSIVKTERKLGSMSNDIKTIYSFAVELKNQHEKINDMKKIFTTFNKLKLFKNNIDENDTTAVENAVVEVVETQNAEIEQLKQEKTDLEKQIVDKDAKIKELETAAGSTNETAAVDAVENAIKDGKVDQSKRAELLAMAKNDLKSFNDFVALVPKKAVNVISMIKDRAGKQVAINDGTVNGLKLRELEKNDPKLVEKIKNETPDVYKQLYFTQYGVELK